MVGAIERARAGEFVGGLEQLLGGLEALTERDAHALLPVRDVRLLAFLAAQGGPATRRAVAANRRSCPDTDLRLSSDWSEAVRAEIARKISWRLSAPEVSPETHAILMRLAHDPSVLVRSTLAYEVRYLCSLPQGIVQVLMTDSEVEVLSPLVEYSPLVSDLDLIAAMSRTADPDIVLHVARRRPLSADVADAVVMFLEPRSLAALLQNPDAEIRACSLDHIAGRADLVAACLDALAGRTDLSSQAEKAIAEVAGENFRARGIAKRDGFARAQIEAARRNALLDDAFIRSAAIRGQIELVTEGLAELADLRPSAVRTVIESGSKRGIVSLVRRAGLNMRTAYRVIEVSHRLHKVSAANEDALNDDEHDDFPAPAIAI
jgi:uncharacterized protein (DUF2336 family)